MEENNKKTIRTNSYRSEEMDKIISQAKENAELLIYYIDYIRNYKVLTDEMIHKIKKFDDNSKMKLIIEYNEVMKAVNDLLVSIKD